MESSKNKGQLRKLCFLRDKKREADWVADSECIWCVRWHPSEDLIASCRGRLIRLWSLSYAQQHPSERTAEETGGSGSCGGVDVDGAEKEWRCHMAVGSAIHKRSIRSLSFSSDGSKLAAASFDSTVSIWRRIGTTLCYKCVSLIEGHDNEVKSVSWSPCATFLATCSRDKTVWLHERIKTDKNAAIGGSSSNATEDSGCGVEGRRGGDYKGGGNAQDEGEDVVGREDEVCTNEEDYFCHSVLSGHSQDVKCVRWNPKLDIIASASYDETIRFWGKPAGDYNNDEWRSVFVAPGHSATVWSLSFRSDGLQMASVSDDNSVKIWTLQRKKDKSMSSSSAPEATAATSIGSSWYLRPMFQPRVPTTATGDWVTTSTLKGVHDFGIYDVDWYPHQDLIATAGGDNSICVLQPRAAVEHSHVLRSSDGDREVNLGSENGVRDLVVGDKTQERERTDEVGWEVIARELGGHEGDVNCVCWRPRCNDGRMLLASSGDDGVINLWEYIAPPC